MIHIFTISVFLLGATLSAPALAGETLALPLSATVAIGETVTPAQARNHALEKIREQAGQASGAYVESTRSLVDDEALTHTIRVVSAVLVRLEQIEERYLVLRTGQPAVHVSAVAHIDPSELRRKIEALRQDRTREDQLRTLRAENTRLKALVQQQRARPPPAAALLKRNEQQVREVIAGENLLSQALRQQTHYERVKAAADDALFIPLLNMPIEASVASVRQVDDKIIATVAVHWAIPDPAAWTQYFEGVRTLSAPDGRYVMVVRDQQHAASMPHAQRLYQDWSRRRVDVVVDLGSQRQTIPLLYGTDRAAFFARESCHAGAGQTAQYALCLFQLNPNAQRIAALPAKANRHPLTFTLDAADAGAISHVQAHVAVQAAAPARP